MDSGISGYEPFFKNCLLVGDTEGVQLGFNNLFQTHERD